eukprot:TRINITY_DN8427_c0_g1_i4.p2 TRINITY_DN8427_c0_g1~~TRINITY_DN8427_c0_g1_i4.p2  ORF type:complete len:208 (-),score=21.02 TRINITY_DN8427_c0_g1_i4:193-816(-)
MCIRDSINAEYMGNGEPMIITNKDIADKQADKFRKYINTPVLTRIKSDFNTLQVYDVEPTSVPDMLAERPIIIFGKYKGNAEGIITLKGKTGRKLFKQTVNVSSIKPNPAFSAINYLWARNKIKLLDYYTSDNSTSASIIKEITNLGLKYNLMTNYTSFVAIDEQVVRDATGKLVKVKQPLPLPQDVSDYAVGHNEGSLNGGPCTLR